MIIGNRYTFCIFIYFHFSIIFYCLRNKVISMPIGVYFRYYSLDFLRSFDPAYVQYSGRFA
jgi:hypothetical protein